MKKRSFDPDAYRSELEKRGVWIAALAIFCALNGIRERIRERASRDEERRAEVAFAEAEAANRLRNASVMLGVNLEIMEKCLRQTGESGSRDGRNEGTVEPDRAGDDVPELGVEPETGTEKGTYVFEPPHGWDGKTEAW